MTAYGHDEFRAEADRADVAAFLTKPVEPKTLLETITSLFTTEGGRNSRGADTVEAIPMVSAELRGLHVLVAEDNDINQEIAIALLTDAGLIVDVAENGRIACERVANARVQYDAILMDVQMPEMDGIEATIRIRQDWSPETLPIIAMTAHAYEAERQRCFAAGMNDHISKPVDPALLVRTLGRWLKPRQALAETQADIRDSAPSLLSLDELPDSLPPFDIEAALRRVNGKRPLLRKLIAGFGEQFADVIPTLRGQIANASLIDARRLAHTLKGVSASLELADVAKAAAEVEMGLAEANLNETDERLIRLELVMAPALAAAARLARPGLTVALPTEAILDASAAALAKEELRTLLKRRSLGARAGFDKFAQASGMAADAGHMEPVKAALDRLDYDRALLLLDEAVADGAPAHSMETPV